MSFFKSLYRISQGAGNGLSLEAENARTPTHAAMATITEDEDRQDIPIDQYLDNGNLDGGEMGVGGEEQMEGAFGGEDQGVGDMHLEDMEDGTKDGKALKQKWFDWRK